MQEIFKEYYNVLKMAKKPTREEFLMTAKLALAVMFVIGIVGFLIYALMELIPGVLK